MNVITLTMDNEELSALYHIMKRAKREIRGKRLDTISGWMKDMSRAYMSTEVHTLVFRGWEYDVLNNVVLITIRKNGGCVLTKKLRQFFVDNGHTDVVEDEEERPRRALRQRRLDLEEQTQGQRDRERQHQRDLERQEREDRQRQENQAREEADRREEAEQRLEESRQREQQERVDRERAELEQRAQSGMAWDTNTDEIAGWDTNEPEQNAPVDAWIITADEETDEDPTSYNDIPY